VQRKHELKKKNSKKNRLARKNCFINPKGVELFPSCSDNLKPHLFKSQVLYEEERELMVGELMVGESMVDGAK
jgi:hypothetical protein